MDKQLVISILACFGFLFENILKGYGFFCISSPPAPCIVTILSFFEHLVICEVCCEYIVIKAAPLNWSVHYYVYFCSLNLNAAVIFQYGK